MNESECSDEKRMKRITKTAKWLMFNVIGCTIQNCDRIDGPSELVTQFFHWSFSTLIQLVWVTHLNKISLQPIELKWFK